MVGIYSQDMIEIIETEDMAKNVVEIKLGRSYPRRMHSMNKYRHNLRRDS